MPDAVTHLCSGLLAHIPWVPAAARRWAPVFVAGAVLPDILSRAPSTALSVVHSHWVPLPSLLLYCWGPLHLPSGILLYSLALTMLFPAVQRRTALVALLAGATLHVLLDLTQRHVGLGYPLLVPFSSRDFEWGLVGSEASVPWAPWFALVTLAVWGWLRWKKQPSTPGTPPEGEKDAHRPEAEG